MSSSAELEELITRLATRCRDEGVRRCVVKQAGLEVELEMGVIKNPVEVPQKRATTPLDPKPERSRASEDWHDSFGRGVPIIRRGGDQ